MLKPFTAAAVQMIVGDDKSANVARAVELVERAAAKEAQLVVLPELFNCHATPDVMLANAEPIPGPTSRAMGELARRLHILLAAGSLGEKTSDPRKMHNTALLFGPDGATLATYRKIHLFDIDAPGAVTNQESRRVSAGRDLVVADTPVGKLGLAICYDLRFPELFRHYALAGARLIFLPSAWPHPRLAHWRTLLRARAIENQMFVVACNRVGTTDGTSFFGHSSVIDPWGELLVEAGEQAGLFTVDLDLTQVESIRERIPVFQDRRTDVYG